jgi:hypothetical protein
LVSKRNPARKAPAKESHPFILTPCILKGPDGIERAAWELRVGERILGRADTKEALMTYYTRLTSPPSSGHWRDQARARSLLRQTVKVRESREEEERDEEPDTDIPEGFHDPFQADPL